MKLHVNTLLDFNNKYSLKDKSHVYSLINQQILLNKILEQVPSLRKRLKKFQSQLKNHSTLITLRFGDYNFRETYLRWIYRNFSDSTSNRHQIHQNEFMSLIKWANSFNKHSRYLKFLAIDPKVNDSCLRACLRISGVSLINGNISFNIKNAVEAEYPKNWASPFYQFEKVAGEFLVNSLQTNFKQCVSGFPFTLVNKAPSNKIIASLQPKGLKIHVMKANNKFKSSKANKAKLKSASSYRSVSSESITSVSSNFNTSKISRSKVMPYHQRSMKLRTSVLLSKASSASSSLAESMSRSASQSKSESYSLVNRSLKASNSSARSASLSQYSDRVSLNYSYSTARSYQLSLAKSSASSSVMNYGEQSLSILSASKASQMLKAQSQSSLKASTVVSNNKKINSTSFRSQSIKNLSSLSNYELRSSKNHSMMKSSSSSQSSGSVHLLVSTSNQSSVVNSNAIHKDHFKWKIEKSDSHKNLHRKISFIVIVLVIIIIVVVLFILQKVGITN